MRERVEWTAVLVRCASVRRQCLPNTRRSNSTAEGNTSDATSPSEQRAERGRSETRRGNHIVSSRGVYFDRHTFKPGTPSVDLGLAGPAARQQDVDRSMEVHQIKAERTLSRREE